MLGGWIGGALAGWLVIAGAMVPSGASAFQINGASTTIGASRLAGDVLELGPAPAWTIELGQVETPTTTAEAPIQYLALDEQIQFGDSGLESHRVIRTRVQTQAGLADVGRVTIEWDPSRESVTVNRVWIIRDGQTINVLETQAFEVLRRETNLEAAMLDGWLTASLQINDLRVGDVVETAFTTRDTGGVLAPHREYIANPDYNAPIGRYRLRVSWPAERPVTVVASPWADAAPRRRGDRWEYLLDVEDLQPIFRPNDLPGRFQGARRVQFTDYADWTALRVQMAPLYAAAASLEPRSPLLAEIDRIRASHPDPADQAAAALRLVQDEVRYLAISIGEAGYVPVPADAVWRARFGDCKGKTALLLALLHGLGIEAEAALVSLSDGDALDERAPLVGWFDHVIVKATINGVVFWLDGTGVGDRRLADLAAPPHGWALVLDSSIGGLERIDVAPASVPSVETVFDVDATAGLDAEAPFRAEMRFTGPTALVMREAVSRLSRDQLQAQLTAGQQDRVMRVSSVDSRYDDATNRFTLLFEGRTRMSWAEGTTGRRLALQDVGFRLSYAAEREGLLAEWSDEPHLINHPVFTRTVIRLRLPEAGAGFRLEANDRSFTLAGLQYDRSTTMNDDVVEAVASVRSLTHEVSAADMALARRRATREVDRAPQILAPASAPAGPVASVRDTDAELEDAEALAGIGDIDGAVAILSGMIEADPTDAEPRRLRAELQAERLAVAEAEADYQRLLAQDPTDSEALNGFGRLLLLDGRPSEAVVNFAVALRLDPSDVAALTGRGAAYYRIGNWERSLADYRAARSIQPASPAVIWGETRALIRLGRLDEGRELVEERLRQDPTDRTALRAIIQIEQAAGRPAEAMRALDEAVILLPDEPTLLIQRAGVRARSGDADGAREDFARARSLVASTPWILSSLCWGQAVQGHDLEQALIDCEAAAIASVETSPQIGKAFVLLQLGREAEALEIWNAIADDRERRAVIAFGRGLTRLAQGDAEGRADIDRALLFDADAGESFEVFLQGRPELLGSGQGDQGRP